MRATDGRSLRAGARDLPVSRPRAHDRLLLLAAVLFGLSVRSGPLAAPAVLAAAVVLAMSIAVARTGPDAAPAPDPERVDSWVLAGVALFGFLGLCGWAPCEIGPTTIALQLLPSAVFVVLAGAALLTRRRRTQARAAALVLVALLTVAIAGAAHIESAGDLGLDVYHLHVVAADAIARGDNPYTDAVVVRDGSPNAAPGAVITGYGYPPITALAYAIGHWLTPDARYTGLAAWLTVLAMLAYSAVRRRSERDLVLMLLLGSVPGLWLVLRAAWTEPLGVALLAVALALWARPTSCAVAIGALLASKQYFLVTAPVMLVHRDRGWQRRLVIAALVVLVTTIPAVLWDPKAFWDSAVAFHTTTAPRGDSSNLIGLLFLVGLEWAPATVVPLALGLLAGVWAGLGSARPRSFVLAMAFALTAAFLVSSQAFANYWFLMFGMCALALRDTHGFFRPAA